MYASNELIYPPYVTPRLRNARGDGWRDLVDQSSQVPQDEPVNLAFSLMMIRLNGCIKCETDSYRAMRGCTACTLQTLRRYKEPDQDLLDHYQIAFEDIVAHLQAQPVEHILERTPVRKAA